MSTRFELTISPEYVPNWGLWQALREIQQNSIDQEKVNSKSKLIHFYEAETKRLIIGNEYANLSKRSLLLGESTKRDDNNLIGKYGEGYKLALLILTRLGFKVTVYNDKEIWIPKIIQSKKFEGDLLVIDSDQNTTTDPNHLIFYVEEISESQYSEFKENCLTYQEVGETIKTMYGKILLNPKFAGKVFSEGLFICKHDLSQQNIKYGYDLNAKYIQLDRDRMKISSFDLFYITSLMYKCLPIENADIVMDLIENDCLDVSWFLSSSFENECEYNPMCKFISEVKFKTFKEKFGENAIPVKDEKDYNWLKSNKPNSNPVMVSENDYRYFCAVSSFKTNINKQDNISPKDILLRFLEKYESNFNNNRIMKKEFNHLIHDSESWIWR